MANETLTEHPEGTLFGVARYSKASLFLFIFDEAEFSTQVRHRFCWMVPPQQLPPAGASRGAVAPRAHMERGKHLSSQRPPGGDVLLMTDGVRQPGHLQLLPGWNIPSGDPGEVKPAPGEDVDEICVFSPTDRLHG